MSTTVTYAITGMSCGHCEAAVTSEVGALPGVESVEVSAERGTAVVTSGAPLDTASVRAAIAEAGYELVDS